MSTITNYLKTVKNLETILYTQDRIAQKLQQRISQLGIKKNFNNFTTTVAPSTEYKKKYQTLFYRVGLVLIFLIFLLIFAMSDGDFLAVGWFGIAFLLVGLLIFSSLLAFIPRAIGGYFGHMKDVEVAKKLTLDKHTELMTLTAQDSHRISRELEMKNRLHTQLELIKNERSKTKQTLDSIYSLNIIHPKYRKLVAITSFYEYFETGRCSQLEGHEGAYNIYEQEIRLDKIITKLDIVISRLEEIKNNQYVLYQSILQANNALQRIDKANYQMLCSLDAIQKNSELIEYNTRCANSRAEAIADMIVFQQLLQ